MRHNVEKIEQQGERTSERERREKRDAAPITDNINISRSNETQRQHIVGLFVTLF